MDFGNFSFFFRKKDDNTDSPSKSKSGKKDADDKTGKKENFKEESKNSKAETAEEKQKTS